MKLIASCGVKMTIAFNYLIICMHLAFVFLVNPNYFNENKNKNKTTSNCVKRIPSKILYQPHRLVFIIILY